MSRRLTERFTVCYLVAAFFVLVLHGGLLFADPVTESQARQVATRWLSKHGARPLEAAIAPDVKKVESYRDDDGKELYYVINMEPTGFVIVSADDLIEPVIAFAEKGRYTSSSTYPLGALVSGDMRGRMAHVRESKLKEMSSGTRPDSPLRKAKKKWDAYLLDSADESSSETLLASIPNVRVSPLLECSWDQGSVGGNYCYNYWTPNNYPSGCVATAMAQLMRYHSYPTAGIGQVDFSITVNGGDRTVQTKGGDNAGGPYVWDSMPLVPDTDASSIERQQIGYLTADAGYSVNMAYTSSSSGTNTLKAADALKNTFAYGNAVKGYNSGSNIPSASYANMMNTNLDAALPVLFGITGPPGGHAIVGDGYGYDASQTMYHHLNLGWGSTTTGLAANAWYNLPDVDTPSYTFDTLYKVVYNIYPVGTGEVVSGRVTDAFGDPLSGVTVTASINGGSTFSYVTGTNTKLDAGIYAFTSIPSDSVVTLSAAKSGYTFHSQTVTVGSSTDNSPTSGNIGNVDFEGHAIQFSDGTLDMTFDPNANNYVYSMAVQPDGKVLIGGDFTTIGGLTRNYIARLNADGTLDTTFNPNVSGVVISIALQPDGKILIGGEFTNVNGVTRNHLARLNADCTLDTTFNPNVADSIRSIVLQPDGKILIGGWFTTVGGTARNRIARLNADGTLDSLNPDVSNNVHSIALQSDGKILLGGEFCTIGGVTRNHFALLNADGTLDTDFDPNVNDLVFSTALQPDGKVLIGGWFTAVGGTERNNMARLNADGTLDTSFNPNVVWNHTDGVEGFVGSIALQPDGKVLIGGWFTAVGGTERNGIARLNSDGTLDMTFDPNASTVWSIVLQPDGKIAIGGEFTTVGGVTRNYIARLGFASPPSVIGSDFNQDNKPDILWRNTSTGQNALWYMDNATRTGSAYILSLTDQNWKIAGTSDFNQDGKPDILWRNTTTGQNALWYMDNATRTGSAYIPSLTDQNWKITGTADFNSDGKPDILWRNASTGQNAVWYMDNATRTGSTYIPSLTDQNWKITGTADFNSDNKPDILWRNTTTGQNALWYMDNATRTGSAYILSLTDQNWKIAGTGDFNSDNKPDILWRNTSTGQNAVWYMDNATRTGSTYIPALADQNWKMAGGQENY